MAEPFAEGMRTQQSNRFKLAKNVATIIKEDLTRIKSPANKWPEIGHSRVSHFSLAGSTTTGKSKVDFFFVMRSSALSLIVYLPARVIGSKNRT